MKITEIETREVEVTVDCLCNKCGESLKYNEDFYGLHGHVGGGYNSTHLQDGCTYEFSLCEKCLFEIFEAFSIPATITEHW